jgi:membrane-associated phospholipid phosphatase
MTAKKVAKTIKKPEPVPMVSEVAVPALKSKEPWYIALLAAGLVLLAGCAVLALPGDMSGLEQRIFAAVNSVDLPDWVASQVAKPLSNAVWGMGGLVIVLLLVPKFRWRAWQYAVAAGSAYTFAFIIEHLVDRGRPAGLPYDVVLRASQDGPGFPSGHVAVLTALGLTLWPFVAWPWRILIVLLIGAEAWSRVFLGVHAPLDVVGGVAAGAVVVGVIHSLPRKLRSFFRLG